VIGVFKQKSPGNIVLLLLLGLTIKIPLFLYPKLIVATDKDGHLYHALLKLITPAGGNNALMASVVAFFLLYVQALMLNYMMNEYRMTPRPSFLAAMAYLILTSLLPEWNYLSSPLVTATLVIWMFILLFKLYNVQTAKGTIYNIGLLAGISSYIFFPSAFFILCLLLGIMILKPFRLNEIFLLLMGCLTPYYFYGVYLFLTDQFTFQNLFPRIYLSIPDVKNSIWFAFSTLLLTIPFLLGGYYVQVHLRKMLIQVRKNWSILLFYLILAIFLPYVNNSETFHAWVLAIAPFAAFHASAYYYPNKNWLPLVLFFLTIGFIFYQQYGTANWR
jgi:hypothetical protein